MVVGAVAVEQQLPPSQQPSARLLIRAIDWYRAEGSDPLRAHTGIRCRFTPTCSRYARAAILERGSVDGMRLTAWRLLRCGPWTPKGTSDPPPGQTPDPSGVQSP